VIYFNFAIEPELQLPPEFVSIDTLVDEVEANEAGRAAMADARRWVGERYYSDAPQGLAAFRLAKGWSQKRLAQELGTSQSHIARIEAGQSDPQISTVRRLCNVLEITIEQFERAFSGGRQSP
jgi:ribosome-binding protein aMBF1 (putative translation factor)